MNARTLLRALPVFVAVAIVVAALLTVWLYPTRAWENDTESYVAVAQSMLSGDGVSADGRPEFFRTPGYPLLLAVGALAGSFWVVSLLQYLLMALTLWLCVDSARKLNPSLGEIPLFKWWLLLLVPHFLVYPALLLSETLFGFLLTASVWFGVRWRATRSRLDLFAGALLLGTLPLVRPIGVVAVLLYGAFLLVRYAKHTKRHDFPVKCRVCGALLLCLLAFGPTLGWSARNAALGGPFAVSTVSAHNMYHYTAAHIQAVREGRPDAEVQIERNAIENRWIDEHPEATYGDLARWNTREGLRTLMETPLLSAFLYLQGDLGAFLPEASQLCELFGITTGNVGTLSVLHQEGFFAAARHYFGTEYGAVPWLLFASGWMLFFLLMLGQAIWVSLWRPVPWLWIFALVGFAQLAVVCLSNPRYLFPTIPLFLILILAANDDIAPPRERR